MKVKYSRKALKFLSKQERATVLRIRYAIDGLTKVPPIGDIKPMQGYHDGTMRLRVGGFRIIYKCSSEIDNNCKENVEILLIIEIGNRGDIYK